MNWGEAEIGELGIDYVRLQLRRSGGPLSRALLKASPSVPESSARSSRPAIGRCQRRRLAKHHDHRWRHGRRNARGQPPGWSSRRLAAIGEGPATMLWEDRSFPGDPGNEFENPLVSHWRRVLQGRAEPTRPRLRPSRGASVGGHWFVVGGAFADSRLCHEIATKAVTVEGLQRAVARAGRSSSLPSMPRAGCVDPRRDGCA